MPCACAQAAASRWSWESHAFLRHLPHLLSPALRMCAGGYFTLDLVAACPYDMLVRVAGGGDRFQAFLRLFKLLRLQRVILWYRRKARSQHSRGGRH